MKKYILIFLALAAGASLHARHRGGWGGGWGGWGGWWGPSVGFTVPLGGSSPKYIMPTRVGDPYSQYVALFPKANPMKNPNAYYRWLVSSNYPQAEIDRAWNSFVANYNAYQASKPRSSGYLSVGVGGGWGPGWGWW